MNLCVSVKRNNLATKAVFVKYCAKISVKIYIRSPCMKHCVVNSLNDYFTSSGYMVLFFYRWYMPLSFAQMKMVLTVLLLLTIGMDTFIALTPALLFYISLGAMVVATCQVLTKKQDLRNFRR